MICISIIFLLFIISLRNATTNTIFNISPLTLARITSILFIISSILSYNVLYLENIESGIGLFSGFYQVTPVIQFIESFMFFLAAFILMPWYPKSEIKESNSLHVEQLVSEPIISEYSLILLFTTLGGSLLLSSSDLISMYLSIELQSFAVYILASINKNSEDSTSASLKYFLLGGLSSCIILLGCGFIYAYTGLTNLDGIYSLVSVPSIWNPELSLGFDPISNISGGRGYLLGLTLILVGFLFKIAAAPFHNWAVDVYDQVPTIVTTWLTIMPKLSIVVFLLQLESGLFLPVSEILSDTTYTGQAIISYLSDNSKNGEITINIVKNLFLFTSFLSLIIGTILGLSQYKVKRLLAYSTISHVGFLLLALAVNTETSVESLIFYITQYSITNLNTFLILLVFGYTVIKNKYILQRSKFNLENKNDMSILDLNYISELKGQFIHYPILSLSLAICLFSMAGIPPLIGFFAKQQVLFSASYSGYYFISIIAIIVSVISASYYLQIIKISHFPDFTDNVSINSNLLENKNTGDSEAKVNISNTHSMTISVLTLSILFFILNPTLLLNSTHLLSLSIFTQ